MPSWEEVQKMIREAQTPQEKAEVAQALDEQLTPEQKSVVIATMRKGKQNVVSLNSLPEAMQNPDVYDLLRKAVTGGK